MNQNQRFCLTLDLKDDPIMIQEYEYWHQKDHIWPEIPAGIRSVGILSMEIYRIHNRLFMIIDTGPEFDFERDMERLSHLPRQSEWEAFVAHYQNSGKNEQAKEKWKLMKQVFSLD
jgi:L-rhamnose mutarotase